MNSLSVKSRLWILVGIVLTALLIVSVAGVSGMQQGRTAVKELGWNRMPSIIGLNYMIRGQLDIKIQNRNALLLEYDPKIAEKAPKLIKARKEAVELILKGRGIYEALPPSPEEVAPWEELNSAWKEWFQGNVSMDGIITELGQSANDQVKIKELIGKYKAQIASNTPLAATTLNNSQKLLDINTRIGSKFYEEADAGMGYAQNAIYALSAAALLVVAGLATLIIRSIVIPLADMQSTMQSIERNNDFTLRLSVKGTDELSQVSNSFNKLVGKIHGSLEQILSGVREINAATGGLSTTASQVSASSAHQSESASSMAAAVEELTVSIAHVSSHATIASDLAKESGKASREGADIIGTTVGEITTVAALVDETSNVIAELGGQSQQISSIAQVIKEVADQTNLLALNAAIEAARAGEQGRGFAVVADEVRKLAERTTVSAVEISDMISKIQYSTKEAVDKMDAVVKRAGTGKAMATEAGIHVRGIEKKVTEAVAAIQEVSTSLLEQRAASENIAQNVESVSQMSEENSAAAGHTADAAGRLSMLSSRMESSAKQFRL